MLSKNCQEIISVTAVEKWINTKCTEIALHFSAFWCTLTHLVCPIFSIFKECTIFFADFVSYFIYLLFTLPARYCYVKNWTIPLVMLSLCSLYYKIRSFFMYVFVQLHAAVATLAGINFAHSVNAQMRMKRFGGKITHSVHHFFSHRIHSRIRPPTPIYFKHLYQLLKHIYSHSDSKWTWAYSFSLFVCLFFKCMQITSEM